jgi:dynamin 1-like protein
MNLSVLDIRTAIRNSTGPRPSLFVPELAFDLLVKPQIKLLEIPSQRCVELVYEELIKICHTCGSTELTRYPRLQGKLIEVVSDLLREQLGPCSTYVGSLIDIQRAYINTNHPNFLGAAAAMSAVINDKEQREKKIAMEAEKKKREKRRLKELNIADANGGEALENGEEVDTPTSAKALPLRKHQTQASRSMSPAVGRLLNGQGSISGQLNNRQRSPPAPQRDSFLNYFFGKDGATAYSNSAHTAQQPADNRPGSRHVSQNIEPSFAQSIRRGDTRQPTHVLEMLPDEDDTPMSPIRDNGYEGGFVSTQADEPQFPTNDSQPSDPESAPALTEREALETELIRRLISSYFNIVRETVADQVPKAIMHLLVNHSKDVVQNRLVSMLYKEDLFQELLYEDDTIKAEREKCEKLLKTYKEAAKIVGEVL